MQEGTLFFAAETPLQGTELWAYLVASCGDGASNVGEMCDLGGLNGDPSACCTASCTLRASGATCRPASGVCDVIETCDGVSPACPVDANGALATKQKLTAAKLLAPGADDKLTVRGEAVIPPSPPIDPAGNGVRFLLAGATRTPLLDVTIPSGAYEGSAGRGGRSKGL